MDDAQLASADEAYAAGDWAVAAKEYLEVATAGAEGSGQRYHRAGNALLKLGRLEDACDAYGHALEDTAYEDASVVACNLGSARAALRDFEGAIDAFSKALEDPDCPGRYKALQGLGGAYFERERLDDAVEAYRRAVLDPANPEPGKALNNLGLCYMKLDRPEDAVEAYRAAVELKDYAGRGRAAANLGMAYAALGMHERAAASFNRARDEFGHEFSPAMEAAYRASLLNAAPAGPEDSEALSKTGPMPSQVAVLPDESDESDTRFFTITDAEMREADRDARRQERSRPSWVTTVTAAAVVVVVVGGLIAAYLYGLGYPTQEMTVTRLLQAYTAGESVGEYWVAVPETDVSKAMSAIPVNVRSYEISGMERSARTSNVEVTVKLAEGGVVTYDISLAREGVGWKVNGVSNSFTSFGSGT